MLRVSTWCPVGRRHMSIAVLGALALLVFPAFVPALAAPSRATAMTVRLKITGGYHYSRTLASPSGAVGYYCFVGKDYLNRGLKEYGVDYNVNGVLNAAQGSPGADSFLLTVRGYTPTRTHYSDPRRLDMTVVVQRRSYYDRGQLDGKFRMTVQFARNGRSGTFRATHVRGLGANHGNPIDVEGSWSCATVRSHA